MTGESADGLGFGLDVGTATSELARTTGSRTTLFEAAGSTAMPTAIRVDFDGAAGVLVGDAALEAGDVTWPLPRFRTDGTDRGDSTTDALRTVLRSALDAWGAAAEIGDAPLTVVVPGAYPGRVKSRTEEVVEAVTGGPVRAVRSPLPALAADDRALAAGRHLVVDIGAYWVDAAVIDTDGRSPPSFTVRARRSRPGAGTDSLADAVVEWAVETTATDAGYDGAATVAVADADRDRLQEAATDALGAHAAGDHDHRLALDEPVEVMVSKGGQATEDEFEIDRAFDERAARDALTEPLAPVTEAVGELFEATPDLDRESVERLCIAGWGGALPSAREAVAATVPGDPEPAPLDDPLSAPAVGASRLSFHADQAGVDPGELVEDRTSRAVEVVRVDGEGLGATRLIAEGDPADSTYTTQLTTALDQQRRGRVELVKRASLTDEVLSRRTVLATELPPRGAGDVSLDLVASPATGTVDLSVVDLEGAASVDLLDGTDEADGWPWLAAPRSRPDETVARAASDTPRVASHLPDHDESGPPIKALIKRLWDVRTLLWDAQQQEQPMSPDELEGLLGSMDAALRRFDIEPIEPEPGAPTDRMKHEEFMAQPAEYEKGRVVAVRKPGIVVDGKPITPAEVIVASAETPPEEEADDVVEESTGAAEEGI